MPDLRFRLEYHKGPGLKQAPLILARELRGAMGTIGARLQKSAEIRMRNDTGRARRSLQTKVTGRGLDLNVTVYSTMLQAFVDAYGLKRGVRVPWGFPTPMYRWAYRKLRTDSESVDTFHPDRPYRPKRKKAREPRTVQQVKMAHKIKTIPASGPVSVEGRRRNSQARRLSYLVARKIFRVGLQATHWNREALNANKGRITRELKNAISRAVNKMNRG